MVALSVVGIRVHCGETLQLATFHLSRLIWNVKRNQIRLKAAGFESAVSDPQTHPDYARDFSGMAEIQPKQQANEEAADRHQKIAYLSFLLAQEITRKGGGVHPHERKQGAEIQQFRGSLKTKKYGTDQGKTAHKQNIVSGDASLGLDRAEERFGNCIAPSHAVKQARRPQL